MIVCENIVKIYKSGESKTLALQGIDLHVKKGEMLAVMGASGSGKSTLLNIIGCLEKADAGSLFIDGADAFKMNFKELNDLRTSKIGFVWQNNARNLIPHLSALENVLAPMRIMGKADKKRAMELLKTVGLEHRIHNTLFELSGGEQQRVSIAVALANEPSIILADEPTGSVDTVTCDEIMRLFRKVNTKLNKTIVIVTHDTHLSSMVDRVVYIRDGKASSELMRTREGDHINQTHDEYSVIDKYGRLQIPKHILEESKISNMVTFEVKEKGVIIVKGKNNKYTT